MGGGLGIVWGIYMLVPPAPWPASCAAEQVIKATPGQLTRIWWPKQKPLSDQKPGKPNQSKSFQDLPSDLHLNESLSVRGRARGVGGNELAGEEWLLPSFLHSTLFSPFVCLRANYNYSNFHISANNNGGLCSVFIAYFREPEIWNIRKKWRKVEYCEQTNCWLTDNLQIINFFITFSQYAVVCVWNTNFKRSLNFNKT